MTKKLHFTVHVATRHAKHEVETMLRREFRISYGTETGIRRRLLTIPLGRWKPYGYGMT